MPLACSALEGWELEAHRVAPAPPQQKAGLRAPARHDEARLDVPHAREDQARPLRCRRAQRRGRARERHSGVGGAAARATSGPEAPAAGSGRLANGRLPRNVANSPARPGKPSGNPSRPGAPDVVTGTCINAVPRRHGSVQAPALPRHRRREHAAGTRRAPDPRKRLHEQGGGVRKRRRVHADQRVTAEPRRMIVPAPRRRALPRVAFASTGVSGAAPRHFTAAAEFAPGPPPGPRPQTRASTPSPAVW
jgi:hypothetical protein